MRINPMLSPSRDIFLQARKEENATTPTQQGVQMANKLVSQYGTKRMIAVAGDIAVALKPQTFSEMESKFGKAKEIEKGIYAFNSDGTNLVANWYKTAVEDEGYGPADKNKDGVITNRESFQVKRMFDFDANGNFFLDNPRRGEIPDSDDAYITLNDAIERDISSDTDKNGIISTGEVKEKEGKDINAVRKTVMAMRGQNPDGSPILPTKEDLEQTLPGMEALDLLKKQQDKLKELEARKQDLHDQGVPDDDPRLKELMVAEKALRSEIAKTDTYQSIDVKA